MPDPAPNPKRILIMRHGKPALDRNLGPKIDWQGYQKWWQAYEESSLAEGEAPPQKLIAAAADATYLIASERPRAQETARAVRPDLELHISALFNEAPLPPPTFSRLKFLPKTWNILARTAWLAGHHLGGESRAEAGIRANEAANHLNQLAHEHSFIAVGAHGWFNRMLRPALLRLGYKCVHDGGDSYWSYRLYEK